MYLALVLFCIISICYGQESIYIPMISCNSDQFCDYQGMFNPNGTLYPGQVSVYSVDLTSLSFSDTSGLAVVISSMSLGEIDVYISESYDDDDSDVSTSIYCDSSNCGGMVGSCGVCDASQNIWFIGLSTPNNQLNFTMQVTIQDGAGYGSNGCIVDKYNWAPIYIISYMIPFLCLICCIGCAIYVVRRRRYKRAYYAVDETKVIINQKTQEPVVYYQVKPNATTVYDAPPPAYSVNQQQPYQNANPPSYQFYQS